MSEDPPSASEERSASQGPPAPPPAPHSPVHAIPPAATGPASLTSEDRTLGMLIHLLALLAGFIGPLILWLVKRENSAFVDHNGKESLNFQISMLVYYLVVIAFGIVLALLTEGKGLFVAVPIFFALTLAVYVIEIIACIRAYQGAWVRLPLTIRVIR